MVVQVLPPLDEVLRSGLEHEGHALDCVDLGSDAVHLATNRDYDVIVIDVTEHRREGYGMCQSLRARGRWSPILLLTTPRRVAERIEGLDAGADDCLDKPFAIQELAARLRALARRRR